MKKLVKAVKSFEWVLFIWVVVCVTLAIIKLWGYTDLSWWWISTPLYVPIFGSALFLVVAWLVGFFVLIGRDLYSRYNHIKATRLSKRIERDTAKVESELNKLKK